MRGRYEIVEDVLLLNDKSINEISITNITAKVSVSASDVIHHETSLSTLIYLSDT